MCVNWLCVGRIGLGWAHDIFFIACHMFMHFPCIHILFSIYFDIFELFGTFLIVSLSPSLFCSRYSVSMALKRKSALSQNPLRSEALSSFDPTPSSIQFCDEDAWKDFSENFSRWGVHLERQVILADFVDTDLPIVIHSRECPGHLSSRVYPGVLLQHHGIDCSVPLFFTCVQGTHILVTPQLVADVLRGPRIEFLDYPSCERLWNVSKD